MAARTFREKKTTIALNINVYIGLDNRERARAWNKQQWRPISLEEKHENYKGAVRKCAVVKKQIEQEHTTGTQHFLHKTSK